MVTPTDASVAMVAHRLLSSTMRSNYDNDWLVHSLIFLSLHDLRGLALRRLPPSIVPHSMIFGSVHDGRHGLSLKVFELF